MSECVSSVCFNDKLVVSALIATFGDVNAAVERLLALGQLSMS